MTQLIIDIETIFSITFLSISTYFIYQLMKKLADFAIEYEKSKLIVDTLEKLSYESRQWYYTTMPNTQTMYINKNVHSNINKSVDSNNYNTNENKTCPKSFGFLSDAVYDLLLQYYPTILRTGWDLIYPKVMSQYLQPKMDTPPKFDNTSPVKQTESTGQTGPINTTGPTGVTGPVNPVNPVNPTCPIEPKDKEQKQCVEEPEHNGDNQKDQNDLIDIDYPVGDNIHLLSPIKQVDIVNPHTKTTIVSDDSSEDEDEYEDDDSCFTSTEEIM